MVQAGHTVGVGVVIGAGCDAEIARLGVDGVHTAIVMGLDPGNVVANGADLPTFKTGWRHQHGEIGLAAGAGEGRSHMVFFALRIGHAQNKHVLSQPAGPDGTGIGPAHGRGNAQCKTFLTEQSIAAVARAVRPNFACLRIVHDVLGFVARPFHIGLPLRQGRAYAVHAGHEVAVSTQHLVHRAAHAGHDALVDGHIGAIAQFYADVRDVRTQRPHRKGHHIQDASAHATFKQGLQSGAHLGRRHPVVGGAGVLLVLAANIGAVFYARHIAGVGQGQEAVWAFDRIEFGKSPGIDQALAEHLVFLLRAVAPVDGGRFAQSRHFGHPGDQALVFHIGRGFEVQFRRGACVHGWYS